MKDIDRTIIKSIKRGMLLIGILGVTSISIYTYKQMLIEQKNLRLIQRAKEETHGLQVISYKSYQEKQQDKETFLVYIGRDTCSYCRLLTPELEQIKGRIKVPFYYFNCITYREAIKEGQEHAQEEWDEIKEEVGFTYIPCLFYYEKGMQQATFKHFIDKEYFNMPTREERMKFLQQANKRFETWLLENNLIDQGINK